MSRLLFSTPSLSKKNIGEYLAKPPRPDTINHETLQKFVGLFSFSGKRIDEAMRELLEKFRLPGESQMIERVMDVFSQFYFDSIKGIFMNENSKN
jgi:Sec7-like guanine-nucleotide exchange factor